MSEPAPVGETGVELSSGDAFAAMHEALLAMSEPARMKFSRVKDIDVRRAGGWMLVTIRYAGKDANEVTFRIRRAWAVTLKQRLARALSK